MWWKHGTLVQGSWGANQRNDFSELQLLHLCRHRKALSSLTWDIWFSLINNHLSMLRPPALCCKTFLWPTFPPRRLEAILSGLLEMLSPGPEVLKNSHWIKHNYQLVGCEWFLSPCNQSDSWVLVYFREIPCYWKWPVVIIWPIWSQFLSYLSCLVF